MPTIDPQTAYPLQVPRYLHIDIYAQRGRGLPLSIGGEASSIGCCLRSSFQFQAFWITLLVSMILTYINHGVRNARALKTYHSIRHTRQNLKPLTSVWSILSNHTKPLGNFSVILSDCRLGQILIRFHKTL